MICLVNVDHSGANVGLSPLDGFLRPECGPQRVLGGPHTGSCHMFHVDQPHVFHQREQIPHGDRAANSA